MLSNKQNISNIVKKPMNWRLGNNISTILEKTPGTIYVDVENASETIPAKMYIDISDSFRIPIGVYNTLPNPNTLVVSQANDANKITYDGSEAKELNITPDSVGALATSGGTMTGPVTTKGIRLTKDVDYGDTLPETLMEGQLSFQTASNLVLDMVYPVGSIYMSVNATSPSTLFGGTWDRIQDRFLLAAGNNYSAGATGGEAAHALTIEELAKHTHLPDEWTVFTTAGGTLTSGAAAQTSSGIYEDLHNIRNKNLQNLNNGASETTGGSQPHNNMPPYLAVYIWKRTA